MSKHQGSARKDLSPSKTIQLSVIPKISNEESTAYVATLRKAKNGDLYIDGYHHLELKVATSCLAQPAVGDRVRFVEDSGFIIILNLLFCADTTRVLTLSSPHQGLHLHAQTLELEATKSLSLTSDSLSLFTRSGKWVTDTLQQISRRLFVRAHTSHRVIEHIEQIQAQHMMQQAEQSYSLNVKLGSINASSVLKIDGGQIHMG